MSAFVWKKRGKAPKPRKNAVVAKRLGLSFFEGAPFWHDLKRENTREAPFWWVPPKHRHTHFVASFFGDHPTNGGVLLVSRPQKPAIWASIMGILCARVCVCVCVCCFVSWCFGYRSGLLESGTPWLILSGGVPPYKGSDHFWRGTPPMNMTVFFLLNPRAT